MAGCMQVKGLAKGGISSGGWGRLLHLINQNVVD